MILEMIRVQNVKWCMKQISVKGLPAPVSVAYLDKHSTLDTVMVSVVGSIPTGGNFLLKPFETLNVNSGLKCKCDLIAKNSVRFIHKARDAIIQILPSTSSTLVDSSD